ncbi:phospholipase A2-like [Paramormyrops kingsleyae]|uniref:phospholipase A2-like n=1 Tax=Paramormyrops kingsleyae TaxID=1676925 RepID=UPI000CD63487|nr:phospholipase A2-like [Paramormyrops kingsleyae]
MSVLSLLFLLLSVCTASFTPARSGRSRRGLLELDGIVKCGTGRSSLAYIMYGCYCGLGGQGWPRDKADWCCHRHDCCYEKAERAGCQAQAQKSPWACETIFCESLKDKCEKMLCRCDRDVAKCLRKAPFIPDYAVWPDFLCGFEYPTCNYY